MVQQTAMWYSRQPYGTADCHMAVVGPKGSVQPSPSHDK